MKREILLLVAVVAIVLIVQGGMALGGQDKNTMKVPGGLAFSEFRGSDDWPVVSISQTEHAVAVIVANPVMIDAFRMGAPGNGKPFPDSAKMAKIHRNPKKARPSPARRCQSRCMTSTSW